MNQPSRLKPLFHPGKLLITPVALAALRENGVPIEVVVSSEARPAATGCTCYPTWPNAHYAQGDRA